MIRIEKITNLKKQLSFDYLNEIQESILIKKV